MQFDPISNILDSLGPGLLWSPIDNESLQKLSNWRDDRPAGDFPLGNEGYSRLEGSSKIDDIDPSSVIWYDDGGIDYFVSIVFVEHLEAESKGKSSKCPSVEVNQKSWEFDVSMQNSQEGIASHEGGKEGNSQRKDSVRSSQQCFLVPFAEIHSEESIVMFRSIDSKHISVFLEDLLQVGVAQYR